MNNHGISYFQPYTILTLPTVLTLLTIINIDYFIENAPYGFLFTSFSQVNFNFLCTTRMTYNANGSY